MRKFMGIDKALQSIQGELLNNTSKLTEINKRIKRDTKKLEEIENDPTYTDEQRQLYRDRLDDSNAKKQARLEILSRVAGGFQPKEEGALKKWLGRLALIHPFLIDVIVIFSQVLGPIHEVSFRNELVQLPLMGVIFSTTKVFYNISSLRNFCMLVPDIFY